MNLQKLEESIGYKFQNKHLLITAMTHKSYAYENNVQSNEKLEFWEIVFQSLFQVNICIIIIQNYMKEK